MKAYEFYILLGKYKRRSISFREFERFEHTIRTERSFRYSFYDSTGERHPHFHKQLKGSPQIYPQQYGKPLYVEKIDSSIHSEEVKRHGTLEPSSNLSRGEYADPVASGQSRHQRVRRRRKSRHKYRWFRLLRDIVRNNPFVFFLLGVAVVAVMIFLKVGLSPNDKQSAFKRIETNSLQVEKEQTLFQQMKPIINDSLTHGLVQSEADKLFSVDPSSFLLGNVESLENIEVSTTGLEKEIQDTIDAMLTDPGKALDDIQLPVLSLPPIEEEHPFIH